MPLLLLLVVLFALNLPVLGSTNDSAVVSGKIVSVDQTPVEDVQVSLLGLTGKPFYTKKDGWYLLHVPANQTIHLVFSNLSFQQLSKQLVLNANSHVQLDVQLYPRELPNVEVIDHSRTSTAVRLDPSVVNFIPSATGDFNALLFSQPGVSSHDELSTGYSVRGGNFDENLVYINDIEVYRPFLARSGQQEGLSIVNQDMVSSILFSAGGFDAKYGDKLSSVLDIQYRKPHKFAATASGSLLGGNATVEDCSKDGKFNWIIGARYKTSQYLLQNTDVQGSYRPSFADIQSHLSYNINSNWELEFLGVYANNNYNVVPQSSQTEFGTVNQALQLQVYFNGQEIDAFQTAQGAFSATYHPSEKLNLKFSLSGFGTSETSTYDIFGQYYINQLGTNLGQSSFGKAINNLGVGTYLDHGRDYLYAEVFNAEHKGRWSMGKNLLLWGVKLQREFIMDQLGQWKYVDSAEYSLPNSTLNQITLQNVIRNAASITSIRSTSFLQFIYNKNLSDTSTLTFNAGIRENFADLNNQLLISPRATLAWEPNWKKNIVFRASGGYYFQPPFFQEMITPSGVLNTQVKAQESIHFVLGSDYVMRLWKRPFKFTVEGYVKSLSAINPYSINDIRVQYAGVNNGSGSINGIDFKINGEFVKGLESWFRLSLMQATFGYRDSAHVMHDHVPLPSDQLVNFTLFFQDYLPKFPDFKMHLSLLFGSALPFGAPNAAYYKDTLRMPTYRRVDIGLSYQILKENRINKANNWVKHVKSCWVGLDVLNLLQVNNVASYMWIRDVAGRSYAIPNYLTNRQLNIRFIVKF